MGNTMGYQGGDFVNRDTRVKELGASAPRDLIEQMENLQLKLKDYCDIFETPSRMFSPDLLPVIKQLVLENYRPEIEENSITDNTNSNNRNFLTETVVVNPGGTDSTYESMQMPTVEARIKSLEQVLENSAKEFRTANPHNLNSLTPFDAFLPYTIIRSFLPMFAKEIVPYSSLSKPYIRLKENRKYIVTQENRQYLRPDIYASPRRAREILDTSKGRRVTMDWYPEGESVAADATDFDYVDEEGNKFKVPSNGLSINNLDLLKESGGLREVGDALDINIHVCDIRVETTNSNGTKKTEVISDLNIIYDVTSTTPQRSISYNIGEIPVFADDGKTVEGYITDTLYGTINFETSTISLVSQSGFIKQVRFGGNLSNKNNKSYLSYKEDWITQDYVVGEGHTGNVPITTQDMILFNECGDINITSNAINQFTEIFANLEDMDTVNTVLDKLDEMAAKGTNHRYRLFKDRVMVHSREIELEHNVGTVLKRLEQIQDMIQINFIRVINELRNTCIAEPFKVVAFTNPNNAALFTGDKVDWTIQKGSAIGSSTIRSDYNMGIITADGNSVKLVTSMKIPEEEGIRFLVYPVNEQNFLSWKHFTYSIYFDDKHRIDEMSNVPNIYYYARFDNIVFNPLGAQIIFKNFELK